MESAGADVPEELFEHIIWYVEIHNAHDPALQNIDYAQALAASKRTLGSCSLVSRYFAKLCRPRLFYEVVLRTFADLVSFISLIDTPHPPLPSPASFVNRLRLQPKPDDIPWLHLVEQDLRRRLQRKTTIDIDLDAAFFRSSLPVRSLNQGLPRTLPHIYIGMKVLILRNIRFKRGEECVRLIGELPLLSMLRLERITWDTLPDVACYRRVHNRVGYIRVIESGSALFTWFLVARIAHQWWEPARTARHTNQLALNWDTNEHDVVTDLCRLFQPDPTQPGAASVSLVEGKQVASSQDELEFYWTAFRTTPDIETDVCEDDSMANSMILMIIEGRLNEVKTAFMPTLSMTLGPARTALGGIDGAHLLMLELDFGAAASPALDSVRADVWPRLTEKLVTLRYLQRIKLLFPSLEQLTKFVKRHHRAFAPFEGPGKDRKVMYYYKEMVEEYVRERRAKVSDVLKNR